MHIENPGPMGSQWPASVPSTSGQTENNSPQELDCCVICGRSTPFRISDPIDVRSNYVEGAGQLCRACANRLDT